MDGMRRGNLFVDVTPPASGETFETLFARRNLIVERIVSSGDVTPTRYVQSQDEWVLLVRGTAVLDLDGERLELTGGDYLFIPANVPHTVEKTSDGALWLALHLHPGERDELQQQTSGRQE